MTKDRDYIPAAGRDWRLPFYDFITKLLGADAARRLLVEQVAARAGQRVLDVGTGTGSLALELKRQYPDAIVTGLDPDPKALAIAQRKVNRSSVTVTFDRGFADALPYGDASFDRVTSSFMFHHLSRSDKERALAEIRRVLKPGGQFHMADFAGPSAGHRGFLARRIHSHEQLRDNDEERVLALMSAAGLEDPRVVGRRAARFARMVYYTATSPGAGAGRR